jgi:hypothetical protein
MSNSGFKCDAKTGVPKEFDMNRTAIWTVLVVLALILSACDPSATQGNMAADGRVRLSVKNSYAEFGDYVVHVNAMTTAELTPEVARTYDIVRSEERALINLVILQKSPGIGAGTPVTGAVQAQAANLTGQMKAIELREIVDGDSIYYIAQVSVDDREIINFDFDIRPAGTSRNLPVRYSHQFYTR